MNFVGLMRKVKKNLLLIDINRDYSEEELEQELRDGLSRKFESEPV